MLVVVEVADVHQPSTALASATNRRVGTPTTMPLTSRRIFLPTRMEVRFRSRSALSLLSRVACVLGNCGSRLIRSFSVAKPVLQNRSDRPAPQFRVTPDRAVKGGQFRTLARSAYVLASVTRLLRLRTGVVDELPPLPAPGSIRAVPADRRLESRV